MKNVDMHMVMPGNSYVEDLYSIGNSRPPSDVSQGGVRDIMNPQFITFPNNTKLVTYERNLVTGDKYDMDINVGQNYEITLAWTSNINEYHRSNIQRSKFIVNSRGSVLFGDQKESVSSGRSPIEAHGIGLLILWSGVSFASYICARFFKHIFIVTILHRIFGGLLFFGSIGFVIIALVTGNLFKIEIYVNDGSSLFNLHAIYGYIIFGLTIIQGVIGITSFLTTYSSKYNKNIYVMKGFHKVLILN